MSEEQSQIENRIQQGQFGIPGIGRVGSVLLHGFSVATQFAWRDNYNCPKKERLSHFLQVLTSFSSPINLIFPAFGGK